jgi:hypothetical protein
MKKMKLNPDQLTVTSFQTSADAQEAGTVFGEQQCTCHTNCTCPGCPTCQGYNTCQNGHTCPASCAWTCGGETCDWTCAAQWTCDLSCDTCP